MGKRRNWMRQRIWMRRSEGRRRVFFFLFLIVALFFFLFLFLYVLL